jgi:hypothetical protein
MLLFERRVENDEEKRSCGLGVRVVDASLRVHGMS